MRDIIAVLVGWIVDKLINKLLDKEAIITAHDPMAINNMKSILKHHNLDYESSFNKSISKKEIIVLLTSWPEYLDLKKNIKNEKTFIFDARRYLNKNDFKNYSGIGLNTLK